MKKRFKLIVKGKINSAEKSSEKFYEVSKQYVSSKPFQDRDTCSSPNCLMFPLDEQNDNTSIIMCTICSETYHVYCEALSDLSNEIDQEEYKCNQCDSMSTEDVISKFHNQQEVLKTKQDKLAFEVNNYEMSVDHLKTETLNLKGKTEKIYESSLRELKTVETSYHSGQLNGKDCEKILKQCLNSENIQECVIVRCFIDVDPVLAEKFMCLFKILANCWIRLRVPLVNDDEIQETIDYCQQWGKKLPILFENRNITRKGHVLSIHVPEYLSTPYAMFNMYYKLEQKSESVHASVNKIMKRCASMRPTYRRLLYIVMELERFNNINVESMDPQTKKKAKQQ